MSAFGMAADDEDGDMIDALRAENAQLRQALRTANGTLDKASKAGAAYVMANETLRNSVLRWAHRAEQAESLLESIGAGGVGPLIRPQAGQPAVKESLTAQDEPVAWLMSGGDVITDHPAEWGRCQESFTPLYTRPQPAARWVGLTDEDRQAVFESLPNALDGFLKLWGWLHFAKAVEAKLREKNAGAQARQPLTDARVAAIVANYCLNVGDWTRNGESVARAIERAHGIGGKA